MSGIEFLGSSEVFKANLLNLRTKPSIEGVSDSNTPRLRRERSSHADFDSIIKSVMKPSMHTRNQPDAVSPAPFGNPGEKMLTMDNPHHNEQGKILDKIMEMQAANRVAKNVHTASPSESVSSSLAQKAYSRH